MIKIHWIFFYINSQGSLKNKYIYSLLYVDVSILQQSVIWYTRIYIRGTLSRGRLFVSIVFLEGIVLRVGGGVGGQNSAILFLRCLVYPSACTLHPLMSRVASARSPTRLSMPSTVTMSSWASESEVMETWGGGEDRQKKKKNKHEQTDVWYWNIESKTNI